MPIKKAEIDAPDPFRPVTNAEIKGILDNPLFVMPPGEDGDQWEAAVATVREALEKLDLNLPLRKDKKIIRVDYAICRPIDQLVYRNHDIDNGLLNDSVINQVRSEIGLRISLRARIGKLLDVIKEYAAGNDYEIDMVKWSKKSGRPHAFSNIRNFVGGFGDTHERKQLAYNLIEEFLSEQFGYSVKFVNLEFIDRKQKKGGVVKQTKMF